MSPTLEFQAAARLYGIAENYQFNRHPVYDDLFARFSRELSTLRAELRDGQEDPFWEDVMRRLNRCRFEFTAYPLPFNHPAYQPEETATYLLGRLSDCERIYPAHAERAGLVLNLLLSLLQRSNNPIGEPLEKALRGYADDAVGLLLLRSRHRKAVQDYLGARGLRVACIGQNDLTGDTSFKSLAVIGPLSWFLPAVLSAPRASTIELFTYGWIRYPEPKMNFFESSQSAVAKGMQTATVGPVTPSTGEAINADEVVPLIPWLVITRRLTSNEDQQDPADSVAAYLFLLAQDFVVFLEAEYGATTSVLNPAGQGSERIRRIANAEIEPGMYLLLRSQGGGDYIASVANSLLGASAGPLREKQDLWKSRLRATINQLGLSDVARDLKRLGSRIADEQNVRNWASSHSLKTANRQDFAAIMTYIGLGASAADLWKCMEALDSAHRRAGARIRKQLLERVEATNLGVLESTGKIDFVLPASEGGAISGFRVEERSPETSHVPITRLGRPHRMERDLWHG